MLSLKGICHVMCFYQFKAPAAFAPDKQILVALSLDGHVSLDFDVAVFPTTLLLLGVQQNSLVFQFL